MPLVPCQGSFVYGLIVWSTRVVKRLWLNCSFQVFLILWPPLCRHVPWRHSTGYPTPIVTLCTERPTEPFVCVTPTNVKSSPRCRRVEKPVTARLKVSNSSRVVLTTGLSSPFQQRLTGIPIQKVNHHVDMTLSIFLYNIRFNTDIKDWLLLKWNLNHQCT